MIRLGPARALAAGLVALGVVLPATPALPAGRPAMVDGDYLGRLAFGGQLMATFGGVEMRFQGRYSGRTAYAMQGGKVSGSWDMDGSWTISGETRGIPYVAAADGTLQGDVSGGARKMRLQGTEANTGSVTAQGFSVPINNSGPLPPVTVRVTDATCGTVHGNWITSLSGELSQVGWSPKISGYFVAVQQDALTESDIDKKMGDLMDDMAVFLERFDAKGAFSRGKLLGLIARAEALYLAIQNAEECIDTDASSYLTIIALMVRDLVSQAASRASDLSPADLRTIALAGVRTGAFGATGGKKAEQGLQTAVEQAFSKALDRGDDAAARELGLLMVQMGWSPLSDSDVDVLFGPD